MPIPQNEIEIAWLYRTPNNQERVALGWNSDGKIVYASRGGNVKNAFDHREASSLERFAEAVSEKVRQLPSQELSEIISACNAIGVIVLNNNS